jgi:hypothetical protein
MWLRKVLRTAAILVPLALNPVVASAQERGLDRAATAGAQPEAVGNDTNDRGRILTELPRGIARVFASLSLPPGIARRYAPPPPPEPEAQPEPEPEPEPEVCDTVIVYPNGVPTWEDCHGNQTPVFGG